MAFTLSIYMDSNKDLCHYLSFIAPACFFRLISLLTKMQFTCGQLKIESETYSYGFLMRLKNAHGQILSLSDHPPYIYPHCSLWVFPKGTSCALYLTQRWNLFTQPINLEIRGIRLLSAESY